ncbi:insulinase family protein [Paracraurococcus ruber]|uniref:Peptidase M16 n=1 Tax=Paracraurococcus ruber TaxID=77675 RepID=A0ABS1CUM0_9PROT|nr:pitrilysin family protein [Paracraurococcus ruber]MBK1657991.1 peptidase M16 [Paracraurococcus ruber]TDG33868.1 insulinase family protein [Paracraurococcus ruber]
MTPGLTPATEAPRAFALPIQVVEANGITAWLVEDHAVPVVSLAWSWRGGAALDPQGEEGAAAMAAALLTEGAGPLRADAFADALRDEAISLSFGADRDNFEGGFRALADALPEAVRLARLAMTAPRLDEDAVERVRARAVASARRALETPRGQAGRGFWARAYPEHPAGRPSSGTAESLTALPAAAIRGAIGRQMRREGLLVCAAGAIGPEALRALIGEVFAGLPEGAPPAPAALPGFRGFGQQVIPVASPQSAVVFGQEGLPAEDPDWEATQVMLRILAGGGFASRLMHAVREQRGLAYGIGAGLDVMFRRGVIVGSVATENARVAETLSVTRDEWRRMAEQGPTDAEREDAVAYLTGSLPLQFADSRRVADSLLTLRQNGRPVDWLAGRAARLRALSTADLTRAAGRVLRADGLSVVVAGQPVGL